MISNIAEIRREYKSRKLDENELPPDPVELFNRWFSDAIHSQIPDANAMTLSTVDQTGQPRSRIVLLKGVESNRFVFYTNYNSSKGREIAGNPRVGLCFFWSELERQVRIDGICEKLDRNESESYFKSRPYESQIGAWTSNQSQPIASRTVLESTFDELCKKYPTIESIPYPEHWGGYSIRPISFEFWQGRPSRLHDRFTCELLGDRWTYSRLSP